MSHFTVMVIGENPESQLQPFHEFECTGQSDQYVQDIDKTKEEKKDYKKGTRSMYIDKDGNKFSAYDDQFYREPSLIEKEKVGMGSGCGNGLSWTSKDWNDGKGYRTKVHFLPEGFTEKDVPLPEVMTFREYIEDYNEISVVPYGTKPQTGAGAGRNENAPHKYGYALENKKGEIVKVIRRTNPNSKWDWYQLGGRWSDFLKLKHGGLGYDGEPSLLMKDFKRKSGHADAALKKHIDIKGMRDEAGKKAGEDYDKAMGIIEGTPINESWETVRKKFTKNDTDYSRMDEARNEYGNQPRVKVWNESKIVKDDFGFFSSPDDFNMTREEYVINARNSAISTYALVKDGKWYQKGDMGWWGMSSNEKEQEKWDAELSKLLDSVSNDTMISIYDCHI